MFGIEKNKAGLCIDGSNFKVVKKSLKKDEIIEKHNHPEANVLFIVVKGEVNVFINEEEKHSLTPGIVLNFDGNNHINAKAIEESEAFVVLIEK